MAEYVWTFYIFNLRIGWVKYKVNNFYKSDGYLSLGKLDFYIDNEY